jgi:hypothetical protein
MRLTLGQHWVLYIGLAPHKHFIARAVLRGWIRWR